MSELPLRPEAGPADPLDPNTCARLLSALAAPERLKIVRFLRDGPRNVGEIADMADDIGVELVDAVCHRRGPPGAVNRSEVGVSDHRHAQAIQSAAEP